MLLKTRIGQELSASDHFKKYPSPIETCRLKRKQDPKNKIQNAHENSKMSTRKHKPSKSNIEFYQHRINTSPIFKESEQAQPNIYSFTHILQQKCKNQQISQHAPHSMNVFVKKNIRSYPSPQVTQDDLPENQNKIDIDNLHVQKIPHRSPIKLMNTNKLSTTPKIKEVKQPKINSIKAETKTFQSILNQQKISNINLECSQKIFKFMEFKEMNQLKTATNGKQNLLSTGLINLSHPHDYELQQPCKASYFDKPAQKISIEQIKQFQALNEQQKVYIENLKLQELRQRANQLQYSLHKRTIEDQREIISLINTNMHPQLNKDESIIMKISGLKKMRSEVETCVQTLISGIIKKTQDLIYRIDQTVSLLQDSRNSNVDWLGVNETFEAGDMIQAIILKNDIVMERINLCQSKLSKMLSKDVETGLNDDFYTTLELQIKQFQEQIRTGEQYISKQLKRMTKMDGWSSEMAEYYSVLQCKLIQFKTRLASSFL